MVYEHNLQNVKHISLSPGQVRYISHDVNVKAAYIRLNVHL